MDLIESFRWAFKVSHQRILRETTEGGSFAGSTNSGTGFSEESSLEERKEQKRARDAKDSAPIPQEEGLHPILFRREKRRQRTQKNKQHPKNKESSKKMVKSGLDMVIIKPAVGKSYADVLEEISTNVKPAETGT